MTYVVGNMASDFRFDTPIVYYGPRAHAKTASRHWILWPAFVYRVVAPEVRERQINIFEKAVLGLCRTGENDPDRIAEHLDLHGDLIDVILRELQDRKLLKAGRLPTSLGESLLIEERGELPEEAPITVGYVFQDPWSNALWPRFVSELHYRETLYHNGHPILRWGSQGSPHLERPFVKRVDRQGQPGPPTAYDVLDAVKRHRKMLRERGPQIVEDGNESLNVGFVDTPLIDRISVVSEEPEPCYLATYLYVPKDDADIQDWHAADPFGLGSSASFRRAIELHMTDDPLLREVVRRLLGRALTSDTQILENLQSLRDLAVQEIDSQLWPGVKLASFYEPLVAMEREHQEIKLLQNCPHDKLENLVIKAGKVLEGMFGAVQTKYPPNVAFTVFMTPDRRYREELLNAVAGELGFNIPLPDALVHIKPEAVRRVCEIGGGTLGQRTIVALLTARTDVSHPLRQTAPKAPDLFAKLGELLQLRNQSAHDSQLRLTVAEADRQVAHCYEIIRVFSQEQSDKAVT